MQFPWNGLGLQIAGLVKFFLGGIQWLRILVIHYVFWESMKKLFHTASNNLLWQYAR
jgi:hypothetical protein